MTNLPVYPLPSPARDLNPRALLGVTMGVTGLLYAVGKKPPDILLIANVLVGVVDIAMHMEQLFVEKTLLEKEAIHDLRGYSKRYTNNW
jgi:hypothetical protein